MRNYTNNPSGRTYTWEYNDSADTGIPSDTDVVTGLEVRENVTTLTIDMPSTVTSASVRVVGKLRGGPSRRWQLLSDGDLDGVSDGTATAYLVTAAYSRVDVQLVTAAGSAGQVTADLIKTDGNAAIPVSGSAGSGGQTWSIEDEVIGNSNITPSITSPPLLPIDTLTPDSTPWVIANAVLKEQESVSSQQAELRGMCLSDDGSNLYTAGANPNKIHQWTLSTEFDLATIAYLQEYDPGTGATILGVQLLDSGTRMFILSYSAGATNRKLRQYSLSTAWDITSASLVDTFDMSGDMSIDTGFWMRADGQKVYIVGSPNRVYEYDISPAWDLTGVTLNQFLDVSGETTTEDGVWFPTDGSTMFMMARADETLFSYPLSTAWDITTAGVVSSVNLTPDLTNAEFIWFKSDGILFWTGTSGVDDILQYRLEAASGSISTVTVSGSVEAGSMFAVSDSRNNAGTNNITVNFGSHDFHGQAATNDALTTDGETATYQYVSVAVGFIRM